MVSFRFTGDLLRDWLGEDTFAEWERGRITGWNSFLIHRKSGFALPLLEDAESENPA
jgi:hypothetical protein